jgi:alpha-beta hydrolase superfamily lysophospholipase
MKYFTVFIKMLSLAALILCIACGNTSKKPVSPTAASDRHSEKIALMDQKNINNQPENSLMRWYESRNPDENKGVALVIHGLNLLPSRMEPIIDMLTDSGIDALNLSLWGHGPNYDRYANSDPARARLAAFKSVTYQLWMDEIRSAYTAAQNRSDKRDVPLFLIGYSLGGLLGADLLVTDSGVQFDKMVLFAPAVKMHLRNYLIRALSPFPRLTIPSFALASYQSNDGTPMAGYNALFDSLNNVAGNIGPKINVPTCPL